MEAQGRSDADVGGSKLLLAEAGEQEHTWRLNFEGFRRAELQEERPYGGLHDCLGALGLDWLLFLPAGIISALFGSFSFAGIHQLLLLIIGVIYIGCFAFLHLQNRWKDVCLMGFIN